MRQLARRILDLGIDGDTPLDLAIAIRAANWAAAFGVVLFVSGAIGSFFGAKTPPLALACLVVALVSAGCLLLSASGLVRTARWVFLVTAATHVAMINIVLGRASGAPFFMILLLAYPIIAFAQSERRQMKIAFALLAVILAATDVATRTFAPLVMQPGAVETAYYVHLIESGALAGFGTSYYRNSTVAARVELDAARRRIAGLLDNTLPPPIAARLAQGERLIADSHSEATILFADLTGFSVLTNRLSPAHLVEVLNRIFSRFDEAAGRHGIEKIKTIGDCYMAATGVLPGDAVTPGSDHMAEFAIDILTIVDDVGRELGLLLGVRIGIATGSVVSGVIGARRFTFDVWGDTVNLASQMESTGVAGRIQVSETIYWRLRERYRFEARGDVTVKSGRRVPTYLLVGRADACVASGT